MVQKPNDSRLTRKWVGCEELRAGNWANALRTERSGALEGAFWVELCAWYMGCRCLQVRGEVGKLGFWRAWYPPSRIAGITLDK